MGSFAFTSCIGGRASVHNPEGMPCVLSPPCKNARASTLSTRIFSIPKACTGCYSLPQPAGTVLTENVVLQNDHSLDYERSCRRGQISSSRSSSSVFFPFASPHSAINLRPIQFHVRRSYSPISPGLPAFFYTHSSPHPQRTMQ